MLVSFLFYIFTCSYIHCYYRKTTNVIIIVPIAFSWQLLHAGLVPYDGTPIEETVTIALPVTVICSALNVCGIVCAAICLSFNIIFRKKKSIILLTHSIHKVMYVHFIIVTGWFALTVQTSIISLSLGRLWSLLVA